VIALAVRRLNAQRPLWLEHEGSHVGKVLVPFGVHTWVRSAPGGCFVVLNMSRQLRVRRLVQDYCNEENLQGEGWVDGLKVCIECGLAKKLGGPRVKEALQLLDEQKWAEVADMMLSYYDKLYTRWVSESQSLSKVMVDCPIEDAANNAALVLEALAKGDGRLVPSIDSGTGNRSRSKAQAGAGAEEPQQEAELPEFKADFSGACFCGEVKVACAGEPRSVSYCHCSICRRLSGAPFSCQALFSAEQVVLEVEPGSGLQSVRTSKGVERSRCASCLSPVQATLFGGKLVALPLGLLTDWRGSAQTEGSEDAAAKAKDALRPRHHLYYGSRVMDVRDGLPKFEGAYMAAKVGTGKGGPKGSDGISQKTGMVPETEW